MSVLCHSINVRDDTFTMPFIWAGSESIYGGKPLILQLKKLIFLTASQRPNHKLITKQTTFFILIG